MFSGWWVASMALSTAMEPTSPVSCAATSQTCGKQHSKE